MQKHNVAYFPHTRLGDLTYFLQSLLAFYETVRPITGTSLAEEPFSLHFSLYSTDNKKYDLDDKVLKETLTFIHDTTLHSKGVFTRKNNLPLTHEYITDKDRKKLAHHLINIRLDLTRTEDGEPLVKLNVFVNKTPANECQTFIGTYATEPDDVAKIGAFSQLMRFLRQLKVNDLFLEELWQLTQRASVVTVTSRAQLFEEGIVTMN